MQKTGWCLVLSGGGTKGVYHLGVWQALQELGIEVEAFVGTSIGALTAALLAQGAQEALEVVVKSARADSVLGLPPALAGQGVRISKDSLPAVAELLRTTVEKRGLDTSPLRTLVETHVDEDLLRRSGKDFGLVTVSLRDLGPHELFLDEIEPGKLTDYLMASAAFPGFEMPIIDGRRYVDGGFHDNVPVSLARRRGWRRLIVSDVSSRGLASAQVFAGAQVVYLRAPVKNVGALEFDRKVLDGLTEYGRLDTLRAFGVYEGTDYYLLPGPPAPRLGPQVEACAALFQVDRCRPWAPAALEEEVWQRAAGGEADLQGLLGPGGDRSSWLSLVRTDLVSALGRVGPYTLWRLTEELLPGQAGAAVRRALARLVPGLGPAMTALGRLSPPRPRRSTT